MNNLTEPWFASETHGVNEIQLAVPNWPQCSFHSLLAWGQASGFQKCYLNLLRSRFLPVVHKRGDWDPWQSQRATCTLTLNGKNASIVIAVQPWGQATLWDSSNTRNLTLLEHVLRVKPWAHSFAYTVLVHSPIHFVERNLRCAEWLMQHAKGHGIFYIVVSGVGQ